MKANESISRAVIVLGMHRSGTSALAGVLNLLGVELGPHLLEARSGVNARGFWEHRDIVAVHDRLLETLGSSWNDIRPLPGEWWKRSEISPFREQLLEILHRDFDTALLWGIKDPRLSRLLPLWLDILKEYGSSVSFVIAHRDPLEVAASLAARDKIEKQHALLLWLEHTLEAEYYSRDYPRVFVGYDELLTNWQAALSRVHETLSLDWPVDPATAATQVNKFLSSKLKHHHVDSQQWLDDPSVSKLIKEVYGNLTRTHEDDETALKRQFSVVRNQFFATLPLYTPLLKSRDERLEHVSDALIKAEEMLHNYETDTAQFQKEFKRIDGAFRHTVEILQEKDEQLADANARLRNLESLAEALNESVTGDDQEFVEAQELEQEEGELQDKVYAGVIDLRVDNNSHTKMFRFIDNDTGERKARVLEVGCSSGYLGAVLKEHGHEVWGVEASQRAAGQARARLDHVFHGTIEDFLGNEAFKDIEFDYIVFGDVLEHLADPLQVLKDCRRILSPRGAITASIPNIAHKAARIMLLEGRWDYDDMGIMDNTHLRFFTRNTIIDAFTRSGFEIVSMDSVNLPVEMSGIKVDPQLLEIVSPVMNDNDQEVFQFVLLARKAKTLTELDARNAHFLSNARPHILCLLPLKDWSIGNIRIRDPLSEFRQRYGGEIRITSLDEFQPGDLNWADTVVMQREANQDIIGLIEHLQQRGKRIIFDIDDLLTEVPSFLSVHEHCLQLRPYLQEALRKVDGITVTTPRLQEEMLQYNPHTYVVPNCAFSPHTPASHYPTEDNQVNLLVASTDTVRLDFILDVLKRLQDTPDLNLNLIGIGPPGHLLREEGLNVTLHENMTHDDFRAFVATLDNTIGLIPLDDSRFSNCKSAVKYLDYALAGIPSICSAVPPYSDVITDRVTGILCKNEEEAWFESIRELVVDASQRTALAEEARRFVQQEYPMQHAADAWHEVLVKHLDAGKIEEIEQKYDTVQERLLELSLCEQPPTEELAKRDRQIADLEQSLAKRDIQIADLEQTLAKRDGQIADINQSLTERDRQIADLNQLVAEHDTQISDLEQSLAKRDGQIADLEQTLAKRDGQIADLEQSLTERDHQISSIFASKCWRITHPIRLIGGIFRKLDVITKKHNKSKRFDATWYLRQNPDVAANGMDPYEHYVTFGRVEGRQPAPDPFVRRNIKRLDLVRRVLPIAIQRKGSVRQACKTMLATLKREGWEGIRRRIVSLAAEDSNSIPVGFNRNDYKVWIRRYDTLSEEDRAGIRDHIETMPRKPIISVVMPTFNPRHEWLAQAIESVQKQLYPHWELCIADDFSTNPAIRSLLETFVKNDSRIKVVFREKNGHISAASNSALELATGDWIALMDHDDLLPEHALYRVAAAINHKPDVHLIYSDEDKIDEQGNRHSPYFKCEWNPDLFYSQNMFSHLGIYRRTLIEAVGGFRIGMEGAQDYDLALRCIEKVDVTQIHHIPHVLYHWRVHDESTAHSADAKPYAMLAGERALNDHFNRTGVDARAELIGFGYRTHYALPATPPLVSLIIPTRNGLALIRQCIESILEKTTYPDFEILVIDNGSDDLEVLAYFESLSSEPRVKVHRDDRPFNYSALNNAAVDMARGEVIGLLNNDVEVISPDWLTEMVSHALRHDVGAVGARLWYPNDTLQHGGVVLGLGEHRCAGHAHHKFPKGNYGYFGRMSLVSTFSAVSAACLVMRKSLYKEVGGLNEKELKIAFNDIDFCLRLREAGYRNIWTPFAELYHYESESRGYEDTDEKRARFATEVAYMKERWNTLLEADPAYSPNLTLDHADFSYAWPPRVEL